MGIFITDYNFICNLGADKNEVFQNALGFDSSHFFQTDEIIKGKNIRIGKIDYILPEIDNENYNIRCNRLLLKCFEKIDFERLFSKYNKDKIGIICAATNTGVQEFEETGNIYHSKISNPAYFIKDYFKLNGYAASISTACSSGIKAFSIGAELLNSGFLEAVIVAGCDAISKVPIFGFDSLEILSDSPSIPFSKNRCGMNIGEGAGIFILEKDVKSDILVAGIGETTDYYHSTTPDPEAIEAINAINLALKNANLKPNDIDYINLHGTGTPANDLMEAIAVDKIFKNKVKASSTKPLTGHCLGAASTVEAGLCCKLIEKGKTKLLPHYFDGAYDENLPQINLVKKEDDEIQVKNVLCTSFGFGGTNAAIILRRYYEQL